ncbi:hypothetical protein [Pseudovibrio ascidiaceicola]|uniref:hypothetical protein n=1 Tax=Pseudovibrio ascidiaceicola TaxID=285279 RepID=UPI00135A01B4|nr:hypothetical protein [Pseudovibrio ascidiaceicola]
MQNGLDWQKTEETWQAQTECGLVYTILKVLGGYLVEGAQNGVIYTNITEPNATLEEAKARCEEGFGQEAKMKQTSILR